ncbi:MAG: helix-turn-helix domain-containing protein [Actinobacteria bacterium]|nr:helix-turn-helix domain-containing protein [Actinomycetota bacterium]
MEGFSVKHACRFTGCTSHQIRYWDQSGLVKPSVQSTGGRPGVRRLYSFRDLVALKVVKAMLDGGMSLQRVRRAWDYLRKKAGLEEHLSEVKLITDGKSIYRVAHDDEEILDALRQGQMSFFVALDEITRSLDQGVADFLRDREEFVETLRIANDTVSQEQQRKKAEA